MFWSIGSNNLVVHTVRDAATAVYLDDATVTAVLKDSTGAVVSGAGSLTGAYQASTNGEYHIVIPDSLSLTEGDQYTLEITTVSGALTKIDKRTLVAKYER